MTNEETWIITPCKSAHLSANNIIMLCPCVAIDHVSDYVPFLYVQHLSLGETH